MDSISIVRTRILPHLAVTLGDHADLISEGSYECIDARRCRTGWTVSLVVHKSYCNDMCSAEDGECDDHPSWDDEHNEAELFYLPDDILK